jgi:CubicO group peptidase (beta-lactamase class C family)
VPLSAQQPDTPNQINTGAVAAFVDEFIPQEMARRHVPGAVFVFVAGGEIAVARGFGFARLDLQRRVDPERTAFRLASVSKTITATAALQLVETGRIDLQTDVNSYLRSFRLPAAHGPITLHHLLTHTAGFDERLTGAAARSVRDVQPLCRYLAQSMPPTFIEPGRVISYSNHGFAVVGCLVEEVSGRPFAEYVRDEIFEPLGMRRSGTLNGSPPDELAVAYEYVDGRHLALSPDYLQVSPAGAFFTTGSDMGRFLIALLRHGSYRSSRILRPETVALMHARHFAQTPDTSGWAYGLWEDARDGQRALLHNGGGKGYRALIYILPEQDAGFFLAYNLADQHPEGELQEVFITQFRRRFVRARQFTAERVHVDDSSEQCVGEYLYVRRARTTMEKMISAMNRVRITAGQSGTLTMTGLSDRPITLTAMGSLLFRRSDERGVVAFDDVLGGKPNRIVAITESGFPAVYERMPLIATLRVQLLWLLAMASVFLYASVWHPLTAVVRKRRVAGWNSPQAPLRLAGIASALNLAFLVLFPFAFIGHIEGGVPDFLYGVPSLAAALLFIPPITSVLTVAALITATGVWRDAGASTAARLQHTLVACALFAFVLFALCWHVM